MPASKPQASEPFTQTISIGNNYGAVLTGAGSTAYVQQTLNMANAGEFISAIKNLRSALENDPTLADEYADVVNELRSAETEAASNAPRETKLLRIMSGVGAAVQVLGSAQPAWDAVKAAARAFGIPL